MSLTDWPHDATPEEAAAYKLGLADGGGSQVLRDAQNYRQHRSEVFGALRRAVTSARQADTLAQEHRAILRRILAVDPTAIYVGHATASKHRRSASNYEQRAQSIRYAIRAAIASPLVDMPADANRYEWVNGL